MRLKERRFVLALIESFFVAALDFLLMIGEPVLLLSPTLLAVTFGAPLALGFVGEGGDFFAGEGGFGLELGEGTDDLAGGLDAVLLPLRRLGDGRGLLP